MSASKKMVNTLNKLMSRGAAALSDSELLTILIDDNVLADALLRECGGSPSSLASLEIVRLRMMAGLGLRRAQVLSVAMEFGRRIAAETAQEVQSISTSDDVAALFRPQLDTLRHEECWVLYLTSSNRILDRQQVSVGGVQGTVVDHRLIIKHAIELLATQLIMVHNHPSGAAEPSGQDKMLTERVAAAAALFDIRLLDHIIISRESDFSFRREGLL